MNFLLQELYIIFWPPPHPQVILWIIFGGIIWSNFSNQKERRTLTYIDRRLLLSKIEFLKIMKNFIAFFFSASEWGRIFIFSQKLLGGGGSIRLFSSLLFLSLPCHFVSSDVRIFLLSLKMRWSFCYWKLWGD